MSTDAQSADSMMSTEPRSLMTPGIALGFVPIGSLGQRALAGLILGQRSTPSRPPSGCACTAQPVKFWSPNKRPETARQGAAAATSGLVTSCGGQGWSPAPLLTFLAEQEGPSGGVM